MTDDELDRLLQDDRHAREQGLSSDLVDVLVAEVRGVHAALRNFELNGSDAAKQIAGIYADLELVTRQLNALRVRVESFVGVVGDLLRHVETRGRGGQQVPFHGDFAEAQPSTVGRLRWWKKRFEEVLGK